MGMKRMTATSKGKGWELFHSLWVIFILSGVLSGLSFYLAGRMLGKRRWGLALGAAHTVPACVYAACVPAFGWTGLHLAGLAAYAVIAFLYARFLLKRVLVYKERLDPTGQPQDIPARVDLNVCDLEDLLRIPEFTARLASRTIRVREQIGRFDSIEQFGQLLELPSFCVERLRPYLSNKSVYEMGVVVVDGSA